MQSLLEWLTFPLKCVQFQGNSVTFHFHPSPGFSLSTATFPICLIDSSLTYIYFYRPHEVVYCSTHGPRKIRFRRFIFRTRLLWKGGNRLLRRKGKHERTDFFKRKRIYIYSFIQPIQNICYDSVK